MFCSSLRKRPEWAKVPATLLAIKQPRWEERKLETHDIAVPALDLLGQNRHHWFRFLLLSTPDLQPITKSMDRIERLYHQAGGGDVGIVFLLEDSLGGKGISKFMELQASLSYTFDIPLIPLYSVPSLQATLEAFQRGLRQTRLAATPTTPEPQTALLPYCYARASMPEHTRNLLSDIIHSIPELAKAATTIDGQAAIREYLDKDAVKEIITFWTTEIYFDP